VNREQESPATLDATGLMCPLPVLKARKALKAIQPGECLRVLATDPASVIDFRHFCNVTENELVETTETGGVFTYLIRKAAG
jgi:tRNA 2-thiouridine synthesizing protein A